ncbi:Pimeloyl-ACP methyl ester carboxylesterase [Sphingobium faniae]|nr:Pimeloyl-ACP methyl ester carboxylesterase [Sphingobium faniae]
MPPQPFSIAIPDADLDRLRDRIRSTRWADDWDNGDWHYGVEREWLRSMAFYWANDFDWRAQESGINRWPQFTTDIDGYRIHFLHVKGKGPDPRPLVLTHGWPWTFWDWKDVIGPLTDPAAHGGDPALSFDLVIPSLPGFAFSTPLRQKVNVRIIGRLWTGLMRDVLGYDRFMAAGGDWGALVTAELGHAHADHVDAVHLAMPMLPGLDQFNMSPDDFAPDEQWMPQRQAESWPLIASHVTVQSNDPQTLAYALADSPVGTAAWLWERRHAWSDNGGDIFKSFDRDFLCTTASLYWLTNSIGSSLRIYKDHFGAADPWPLLHDGKIISVPTGFAIAPKELIFLPRKIAEERTNLHRWTILPSGGHFSGAENPAALVDEYRALARAL